MNLNDSPSAGPLTAADLTAYWPNSRRPYVPKGCDEQGRIPEAAHAASEIDADGELDPPFDLSCVSVWIVSIIGALGFWAAIAAFALALRQ